MQNEVETVKSALKGDTEAFRSLVEAYQKPVYMLVLSSVRDEFQAQDLTQETFIRVYLNLEKLKEPSKFGAWICGIARNVTGRWLERCRATESLDDCLEQNHADFAVKENADIDNDWLWQGIYSLPESLREVILLFYMRSISRRDIAHFLNISE
ncbi:MAG: sigma-70 family RNA polymerase sigma factor [Proteobacteria bacterium]|nr:sigma-70 family RNA polymerase sigma factor [Pseudomonadota bacterium]